MSSNDNIFKEIIILENLNLNDLKKKKIENTGIDRILSKKNYEFDIETVPFIIENRKIRTITIKKNKSCIFIEGKKKDRIISLFITVVEYAAEPINIKKSL